MVVLLCVLSLFNGSQNSHLWSKFWRRSRGGTNQQEAEPNQPDKQTTSTFDNDSVKFEINTVSNFFFGCLNKICHFDVCRFQCRMIKNAFALAKTESC